MSPFEQVMHNKGYRLNARGEWYLPGGVFQRMTEEAPGVVIGKRIRQSRQKLNKLETEWYSRLSCGVGRITAQAIRFQLADGLWYKPDFVVFMPDGRTIAYEVKGPKSFRGGFENLKSAADKFIEILWILVWKENEQWLSQIVEPSCSTQIARTTQGTVGTTQPGPCSP